MIKYILIDLDDSFLKSDKTISKLNKKAIDYCKENNIIISITTSRSYPSIKTFINELNLHNYPHICENGLLIYYPKSDKIEVLNSLSREVFITLRNTLSEKGFTYFIFLEDCAYFEKQRDIEVIMKDDPYRTFEKKIESYDKLNTPLKMSCIFHGEEEYNYLSSLAKQLDIDIKKVAPTNVNFVPKYSDKYYASKIIAKRNKINDDEILSIGDTTCDLLMIKNYPNGYAVKNCDDVIRQNVTNILPYTNNEDAFYHLIFDVMKI